MILEEYREALPVFERMQADVTRMLHEALASNGLMVTAVEARIKTRLEQIKAWKAELKRKRR